MKKIMAFLFSSFILLLGCQQHKEKLFTKLEESRTGITFNNLLKEDDSTFSILNYPYFYNGAGVGVGDINNDGLQDVLFAGNMIKNQLYLNKGEFKFEDISNTSGISTADGWNTGVAFIDINQDGWEDIYVCRSGLPDPKKRKNLLFINNHDLTFTERAGVYGLDDAGYSTQASFFDYDKDGDLDMFLINQSDPKFMKANLDYIQNRKHASDSTLGNKLFKNDHGHFTNVSKQAGITSTIFSFSLGLSTSDINQDGWPDIYIGNDFEEPDYLYINNKDGTFTDELAKRIDHTSLFSMGMDIADYNNDLLPDLIQMDMLPEGNYAQKMHLGSDHYNRYNYLFKNGMFPQFMRNSLQKNNGDGTFSEIGQFAGISKTDWSWSSLFADFDNDGLKDLFVTNGYQRDNTDMQFIMYALDQSQHIQDGGKPPSIQEFISRMPGIHYPNYIFKNNGADKFENKINEWGFDQPTFSHGAAYADFDNDGDLDLIINNTGQQAGVYRNNSEKNSTHNFIRITLKGDSQNKDGIGARIYAYGKKDKFYVEQVPTRGFQSCVDKSLHIGLGQCLPLDSLRIIWPNNKSQLIENVKTNQSIILDIANAIKKENKSSLATPLLKEIVGIDFVHTENDENDFTRQFLLPHSYSHQGPSMAKGDVNGDGFIDIFVGGAKEQAGAIFLQSANHSFTKLLDATFQKDAACEDGDAAFFDADGDTDLDLYVVSGGYEFEENSPLLQDRLYINDGKGMFTKSDKQLEPLTSNNKIVRPNDFDKDGDMDLFLGGSVIGGNFPLSSSSKMLINNGKGFFSSHQMPDLQFGLVNDARWIDLDHDGNKELIMASEWMPLRVYKKKEKSFEDISSKWFPFAHNGWWNTIAQGDFDNDGDLDLIVGNQGTNSQLQADEDHPMMLYYPDADSNGSIDPIITYFNGTESVPLPLRDDLIGQIPSLKKKFIDYPSYAKASINDILTTEQLKTVPTLKINTLETLYLENTGNGFAKRVLPMEAQLTSVNCIAAVDMNKDGNLDLILAGNNHKKRIYLGRDDANHGQVFLGDGKGNFTYVPQPTSGLNMKGDVRSILIERNQIHFGINNQPIRSFQFPL